MATFTAVQLMLLNCETAKSDIQAYRLILLITTWFKAACVIWASCQKFINPIWKRKLCGVHEAAICIYINEKITGTCTRQAHSTTWQWPLARRCSSQRDCRIDNQLFWSRAGKFTEWSRYLDGMDYSSLQSKTLVTGVVMKLFIGSKSAQVAVREYKIAIASSLLSWFTFKPKIMIRRV